MANEHHHSLTSLERRLDTWANGRLEALQGRVGGGVLEFVVFTVKQAWACVFGAAMLALLVATHLWYPEGVALSRSDALVIGAVAIQALISLLGVGTPCFRVGRKLPLLSMFGLCAGLQAAKT